MSRTDLGFGLMRFKRGVSFVMLLVALAAAIVAPTPASAHDGTTGAISLVVNDTRIAGTAPVPFAELGFVDTSGDGLIDAEERAAQDADLGPTMVDTVREHVQVTIDGESVKVIAAGTPSISEIEAEDGASPYVTLLLATEPHDGDVSEVTLAWSFDSPVHEVVLTHADGAVTGDLSDDSTVEFSLTGWASATSFFGLGVEHIQFGPDHLLFLLVMTLAVAGTTITGSTVWRTVKLVTAFTIGHAVSLCLAYFDLVSVPASVVEPLIALSIVAGAVLAIMGRDDDAKPWIVVIIGLVHGLGFASSLSSIGVATAQRAPALAAFNLGIDVAQTAVVLVLLAILWVAGKALKDKLTWLTIPAAAAAGLMGLYWTITRVAGI